MGKFQFVCQERFLKKIVKVDNEMTVCGKDIFVVAELLSTEKQEPPATATNTNLNLVEQNKRSSYKLNRIEIFTFGFGSLDTFLGGGFRAGAVHEIFGESNVQAEISFILHQLLVNGFRELGGLNAKLFYIDTKRRFSLSLIDKIAKELDVDIDHFYENFHHRQSSKLDQLKDHIDEAVTLARTFPVSLVIVDSFDNFLWELSEGIEGI